jgi:hypothetical protein
MTAGMNPITTFDAENAEIAEIAEMAEMAEMAERTQSFPGKLAPSPWVKADVSSATSAALRALR